MITNDELREYCNKTYGHRLVAEGVTKLLGNLDLAGVVLLADTKRGREQIVLCVGGEGGLDGGGVVLAVGLDELLGKVLLLLTSHVDDVLFCFLTNEVMELEESSNICTGGLCTCRGMTEDMIDLQAVLGDLLCLPSV